MCFGRQCGTIELDTAMVATVIRQEFGWIFSGAAAIIEAYGGQSRDPQGRKSMRACATFVAKHVAHVAEHRVSQLAVAWFDREPRNAETRFQELEVRGVNWDSPPVRTFVERICAVGSSKQRLRLAKLLRRHVAGVRPGPPQVPVRGIKWLRTHLATLTDAVTLARDPVDPVFDDLSAFIQCWLPGESPLEVGYRVKKCRRRHEAIELLVGKKFSVGRPLARKAIQQVRAPQSRRRYS